MARMIMDAATLSPPLIALQLCYLAAAHNLRIAPEMDSISCRPPWLQEVVVTVARGVQMPF